MATVYPSESQISGLPKWARVAFAVRCARRLEQLMHANVAVPGEFGATVAHAIQEAELSAEYGVPSDRLAEVSKLADDAHESAQDWSSILPAMTAAVACWVAKAAQFVETVSASAAYGAGAAAQRYGCSAADIQSDFDRLLTISRKLQWSDRSPASLDLLPPLSQPPQAAAKTHCSPTLQHQSRESE